MYVIIKLLQADATIAELYYNILTVESIAQVILYNTVFPFRKITLEQIMGAIVKIKMERIIHFEIPNSNTPDNNIQTLEIL